MDMDTWAWAWAWTIEHKHVKMNIEHNVLSIHTNGKLHLSLINANLSIDCSDSAFHVSSISLVFKVFFFSLYIIPCIHGTIPFKRHNPIDFELLNLTCLLEWNFILYFYIINAYEWGNSNRNAECQYSSFLFSMALNCSFAP